MKFYNSLRVANRARQQEWDAKDELSLSYKANELAGEIGEVCNAVKKLERERLGLKGSRITMQEVEDEFGDAMICLDLLADRLGIDLGVVARNKFNRTSAALGFQSRLSIDAKGVA